jgi:hypothetical protein
MVSRALCIACVTSKLCSGTSRGIFGGDSNLDPITGAMLRSWREGPSVEVRLPTSVSHEPGILMPRLVLVDRPHCNGGGSGADQAQRRVPLPPDLPHQPILPLLFHRSMRSTGRLGCRLHVRKHLSMRYKALGVLDHGADHRGVLRQHGRRKRRTLLFRSLHRHLDPHSTPGHDLEDELISMEKDANLGCLCSGLCIHGSSCRTRVHHVGRRLS